MKHLYFIRHGQSEMNKAGLLAGSTETPLSSEGREQAKLAGQDAKKLEIDLIISSPMSRAKETAEIIAAEISYQPDEIIFDKRLVERNFGSLEGSPWSVGMDLSGADDLETIEHLRERIKAVLNEVHTKPNQSILLVAHGAVYRMFRELIEQDYTFVNKTAASNNAELIKLI